MADIDIIMGVFNEEQNIKRAVDSILRQSFEDWRLLVCDDGSTDRTAQILDTYAEAYPHKIFVYRNHSNRGLTYSLNRLIGISKAPYLARMDGDDLCHEKRLEREKAFLDRHPEYALVGSSINKFDGDGVFARKAFPEYPGRKDLLWNNPFAHPTVMIRRSVLLELGGYRDVESTVRCEDYDLWMRLYERGYKGYNIQEPLLYYYEGRSSYAKRKFKYRWNEIRTRFEGFKRNGLLPQGILFVLKPLAVGLVPAEFMVKARNGFGKKKNG